MFFTLQELRKISQAIYELGFVAKDKTIFLTHAQPRLFLAIKTNKNAKERLIFNYNHKTDANYVNSKNSTKNIVAAWTDRWLKNRIKNAEILNKIKKFNKKTFITYLIKK